jgi:regulatory protein
MNKQFLQKAAGFCAYQERTHAEVRERLREWCIYNDEAEEMIVWLIENNYLNEERFAKAYAGGKFRIKNWGRLRIKNELKMKGLSEYCIKVGLAEIEEKEYQNKLRELLEKKKEEYDFENQYLKNQKLARYFIGKGYESNLVWDLLATTIDES